MRTDIEYRPRRQLVCPPQDPDAAAGARTPLVLRFFTFYPNEQKALQPGHRVRAFGEVREGHFGLEIVHPQFKVVAPGAPLPTDRRRSIRPLRGSARETLRGVIARAIAADPARTAESLPEGFVRRRHLWKFGDAVGSGRAAAAPERADAARARRAHASGVDALKVDQPARAAAVDEDP